MDFLSKLWSGIKQAGASIGSTLRDVGTDVFRRATGQYASASTALNFDNPVNNAYQATQNINQTLMPTMSTPYGPGAYDKAGNLIVYNQGGSINQTGTVASALQSFNTTNMRPSTVANTGKVDQYGRESSRDVGQPYMQNGRIITPRVAFSGLGGAGGAGLTSQSTPTGVGGIEGVGGGSAFTGLLGATGTSAVGNQTLSEDEKRKQQKDGTQMITTGSPVTDAAVNAIASPFNVSQFTPPDVPPVIDAGYLSKVQESVNKLASSGSALSLDDRNQVIGAITQNLMTAKARLDQQMPTEMMQNMVEDTPDQLEFINQSGDPFGVKQAMDEFRMSQTNLGQLMSQRVDLMKNIQALNDAYKPIITDIKKNPDLPKALARRRLEDLATSQKEVLQGFLDQLEIVKQSISDQNEMVNRNFQIMSFANTAQNQAQDNARQALQMMISSGAIGGATDDELSRYASSVGVSVNSLKKAREAALEKDVDVVTNEFADGTLRGIDKNTGKTLWSLAGAGTSGGNQGSAVVNAYSDAVRDALAQNLTAAQAVDVAAGAARDRGKSLTTEELSALTNFANEEAGRRQAIQRQLSAIKPSGQQASAPAVQESFFSRLFGNSK